MIDACDIDPSDQRIPELFNLVRENSHSGIEVVVRNFLAWHENELEKLVGTGIGDHNWDGLGV